MYYWSPTMGERAQVDAAEVANIVAAFEHLRQQEFVDPDRVGLAGFSVAARPLPWSPPPTRASPTISPSSTPFGGYYDTADLMVQIAAGRAIDNGRAIDDGEDIPWEVDRPHPPRCTTTCSHPSPNLPPAQALLEGTDSIAEARGRYAELPESFRAEVDSIAPSHHVAQWSPPHRHARHARPGRPR